MITIKADFNATDRGRLVLSPLAIHDQTPFAEIADANEPVLFVQGEDVVTGRLELDPKIGWVGVADWATQDVLRSYPAHSPSLA